MKRCLFVVCLMLATVTHLDGQVIIRERVELKAPLSQTQLSLLPSSTRSLRIEAFWGGSTEGTLEIIHTVVIGGGTQFGCTIPRSRGVGSISYTIPSAPAGRYEIHLNLTGLAQPTQATVKVFLDDLLVAERTATHQAGPLGDPPPLSYQPPYSSRFHTREAWNEHYESCAGFRFYCSRSGRGAAGFWWGDGCGGSRE
jgi:hypothetical protein